MTASQAGEVVIGSVRIKADVVSRDEREGGLRAILNFGHNVGHALEMLTGYSRFLHGEAVAIGMAAEARIAEAAGLCGEDTVERIDSLLKAAGLSTSPGEGVSTAKIIEAFGRDKKTLAGIPKFIMPREIGRVEIVANLDAAAVLEGLLMTGFSK